METTGIDWSRVNMEEKTRGLCDEEKIERMGLVKVIMENNIKMLEIQKTIESIKEQREREIRKKKEKRTREEEEDNRWRRESYERNEREREEREEKKRVDEECKRIEKIRMVEERKAEKE